MTSNTNPNSSTTAETNMTTWNRPTPLQRNEQQIERMHMAGVITSEVAIHLFLQNARAAASEDPNSVSAIFEGLEGFYWVVSDTDDAARLVQEGYARLPKHHLEDCQGISVVHSPSYREDFELDARGRITFDLGDDVVLECEVRRYNGKPRLRISGRGFSGALAITPEAGNILNITSRKYDI